MGNNKMSGSTYTVSVVLHEQKRDGTGTLLRVEELISTKDFSKASKLTKQIYNTYDHEKEGLLKCQTQ